ncbi:MAG: hypothetical protein Q4F72_11440 [Desulfovibrionaceae bacterium]|nr:hypothetical protein [Desulfovibrionaceae bacterium]
MKGFIPVIPVLLCLSLTPALAMPGMQAGGPADDQALMNAAVKSFQKADTSKDDELSKEEFLKAYPSMKEEAFTAIDTDRNGSISRQEWQTFAIGHSMGRSGQGSGMPGGMGGMSMPPSHSTGGSGLPMVTPPSANTPVQGQSGLPGIMPPEGK